MQEAFEVEILIGANAATNIEESIAASFYTNIIFAHEQLVRRMILS